MRVATLCVCAAVPAAAMSLPTQVKARKHHHRHSGHFGLPSAVNLLKKQQPQPDAPPAPAANATAGGQLMDKMKSLEDKLEPPKEHHVANHVAATGKLDVNGPLPTDFNALFAQSVSKATHEANIDCPVEDIKVLETNVLQSLLQTKTKANVIVEIVFQGPSPCVNEAQKQAAEATSPLIANTPMYQFLVAKGDDTMQGPVKEQAGIDINTEMPFGNLEAFGRENTAAELTAKSIDESNTMVDQIERAQVAEEKRAVFRALTRLRGAAISSFDGVARSQTGNIDAYNRGHQWRATHPLHHLAAEEGDVTRWAFPNESE